MNERDDVGGDGFGELEASLRAVLDALPEPAVVHERGRIKTANRAFVTLLAVESLDDLVGHGALEFVHPDDRDFVLARLESTLKNRRTPEHRLVNREGTVIPVEVTGVPFPFGGKVAALAVVHDLRERKKLDAELAAADRLASLGRLASAVGHEINNPLTYVLGALDVLRRELPALARGPEEAERIQSRIADACEGATRVRDIVRDLKTLSSPHDGPVGPVDLHRVLDRAAATAMHEIEHRARLVRDYGDVAWVSGSEGRLIQVFVNLLVNAAQAIPDGEAAANEIRIATRMIDAEHVSVEVVDSGRGFAPGDHARLFEPLFTTKATGIGLGLAIARRIVGAFGGTIVAQSREPRGAAFRVTLLASERPREIVRAEPAEEKPLRRARVLFADDEPLIRNLAAAVFAPHDVVTAASGRAAIELLQRDDFDAIVCDLQMPDLGGVDVYDWLVDKRPDLVERVVFMTGGAFTERAQQFVAAAARPCIEKPLDLRHIRRLVDALIKR